MTTQIDFRTLPANVPSLCIPRVYSNIDEARIRRVFEELDMGDIQRIDVIGKTNEKGDKFNRIFVHFKQWNASENANIARERLINGKEIKILYDDPWFWKVSAYREPVRPSGATKPAHRPQKKASIQIDSDDAHVPPTHAPRKHSAGGKPREPKAPKEATEPREPKAPKEATKEATKEPPSAQQLAALSRWSNRGPPPAVKQEQESVDL
jgi:hypothetical protein